MNKGGTVDVDGVKFTMTHADHSSELHSGTGRSRTSACRPVDRPLRRETFYFAGDTALFGDMRLIGDEGIDVAILPSATTSRWARTTPPAPRARRREAVIPCHYGTFPILAGHPDHLREHGVDIEIIDPAPGETVTL